MANSKSYKNYDYISRYESFPYYYDAINNRYYYGITANLDESTPFASYIIQPDDTYDSIAYDYYGSALFYWIICDFNRIKDSLSTPEPGTVIKLPSLSTINFLQR